MKHSKKIFALLLSVIMVLATVTTAFAATHTIKLTGTNDSPTAGHTYKVYQIFTGDVVEEKLENIKYGSAYGTTGTPKAGDVVPLETVEAIKDARAFAKTLNIAGLVEYDTLDATNEFTLSNVPEGYYLIVDTTNLDAKDENGDPIVNDGDSLSQYIVKVVGDVDIAPKSDTVTSDKKEYNDAVELTDVNEAGVGTVVSYQLTADIAANADKYDFYYMVLRDNLSEGLTFNDDIAVYINNTLAVEGVDYEVITGTDAGDYTFEIALLKAKETPGASVKVNYSATLNDKAVAMIPETNEYDVVYSRKPETTVDHDEHHPGKPVDEDDDALGKTPKKETKTYTTKLVLTKKNESQEVLAGATFRLESANANQTVVTTGEAYRLNPEAAEDNTYYLLKDGTYTTDAPTYDSWQVIGIGDAETTTGYILVDGEYVVPEDTKDYVGATLYKKSVGNSSLYVNGDKYEKYTVETTSSTPAPVDVYMTTGEDGTITFTGLGNGNYTLTEVVAPEGYNLIDPITFTITFDAEHETFTISEADAAKGISVNGGVYDTTVVDKFGSTLPETGGMGTTIFYVVGSVLVMIAGVLLITKRRMVAR